MKNGDIAKDSSIMVLFFQFQVFKIMEKGLLVWLIEILLIDVSNICAIWDIWITV